MICSPYWLTQAHAEGGVYQGFHGIVQKNLPSVVSIYSIKKQSSSSAHVKKTWRNYVYQWFYPPVSVIVYPTVQSVESAGIYSDDYAALGAGTGFIIDSPDLILTANHVVANSDDVGIAFTLSEYEQQTLTLGQVIGRDPILDIALIQFKSPDHQRPLLVWGDSEAIEEGSDVATVGNYAGNFSHSISFGQILQKKRQAYLPGESFHFFQQLNLVIAPGCSGAPVFNTAGEVIGIIDRVSNPAGFGFSIPSHLVKAVFFQLKTTGRVERGHPGIKVDRLSLKVAQNLGLPPATSGVIITQITSGGPGQRAQLQMGDVLTECHEQKLPSIQVFENIFNDPTLVGQTVSLKLIRNKEEHQVQLFLPASR